MKTNAGEWQAGDCYTLPAGWTWADVLTQRAKWDIDASRVPLCGGRLDAYNRPIPVVWGTFLPCDARRASVR